MSTLGDRLRFLIHERGMDQKQFAEVFGLKLSTLNGYVTNYRTPDIRTQKRLADFFGVTVDYLIGRTDDWGTTDARTCSMAVAEHLNAGMAEFVMDPRNGKYLQFAADIKQRGIDPDDILSFSLKYK